jgi:folylpolyglutamate synthase
MYTHTHTHIHCPLALYTSPHLVDIRERLRVNGEPMEMEPFLSLFWRTFNLLKATQDDEASFPNPEKFRRMPGYFYFLTLMALQAFTKDTVDVLVSEWRSVVLLHDC